MGKQQNPVGWFEIPVHDMRRAKIFYETVLDLILEDHEMGPLQMAWFPMSETGYGSAGSLVKGEGCEPSPEGTLVYFTAPDLEATLARARDHGGVVLMERMSIGEYGFIALVQDTEGNRIGLHSRD